jgi:hypothetical protein
MTRTRALVLLLAAALLAPLLAMPTGEAAVAPGCSTAQPTFVGGTIRGYPDGRFVDTHIGILILDGSNRHINPDGTPNTSGGYSWIEMLNHNVAATGTTDSTIATDRWGRCVTAAARTAWIEAYPKRADQTPAIQLTDQSRYGDASYYGGRITPGVVNSFGLRLPLTWQNGGNTGGMQGYIWHAGHNVPASAVTNVVAFSQQLGAVCGVEGLAASAYALASATNPDRTYYKVDFLSAGQCGAAWQLYSLQATCHLVCGASNRTVAILIRVVRGRWPRVDIVF